MAFRAESTVMSGTPVISTLTEGLAGAVPGALRGVLNATANAILSHMAEGMAYADALAQVQRAGLAEPDPAADVEGHDTVAKVMILSALVFGRQLTPGQVACRGITGVTGQEVRQAVLAGGRIRHVAALAFSGPGGTGTVTARVRPEAVPAGDQLARIDGATNALVCQASPVGQITIIGPGAGPQLAGQGVLSDIIAVPRTSTAAGLPGLQLPAPGGTPADGRAGLPATACRGPPGPPGSPPTPARALRFAGHPAG
ncbi:MAG: hypothetical protein JO132_11950 [Streptosporangiaceae bacterium]|nr:hypothetical protein [Streptosporangiaceae bacterium]